MKVDRRYFIESGFSALVLSTLPWGCQRVILSGREEVLLDQSRHDFSIVKIRTDDAWVLRRRAKFISNAMGVDLKRLSSRMEKTMRVAKGVGLACPQVGLSLRAVVVLLDWKKTHPRFVFAKNPTILQRSDQMIEYYEACLSIPKVGGLVRRNHEIKVRYEDIHGQIHEEFAQGANAVLWQHEIDHLNGALYIDRMRGELISIEEMRRLRKSHQIKIIDPRG